MILTLTAKAAHLWQATRFAMTKADIPGLPASIESLDEAPDHEASLQSHGYGRPNTGDKNMPKTQLYGDSPEEWRKGRLVKYARRISLGLSTHLAGDTHCIILVADAKIGGHVRNDEAHAPLIARFVEVNPAALNEAAMKPIHHKARETALGRLAALIGRGDASACTDPEYLNAAAQDGRAKELFVAEHQGLSRLPKPGPDPQKASTPPRATGCAVDAAQRWRYLDSPATLFARRHLNDRSSAALTATKSHRRTAVEF